MPKFTLVNADFTLQFYTLLDVLVLGRNRNWGHRWLKDGALLSKCSSCLAQTPERNWKNYQPQPDTKRCVDYCKAKLNFKDIWLNHHWVSRASASCRRMDRTIGSQTWVGIWTPCNCHSQTRVWWSPDLEFLTAPRGCWCWSWDLTSRSPDLDICQKIQTLGKPTQTVGWAGQVSPG